MDFIMKLPKSDDHTTGVLYNSILVVVDKLTKYLYLILCKKTSNIKQIAWLILDRIIKYYRIPETITSDKNKIFISNFWQTLIKEMGIKLKFSTVYHPQTDG